MNDLLPDVFIIDPSFADFFCWFNQFFWYNATSTSFVASFYFRVLIQTLHNNLDKKLFNVHCRASKWRNFENFAELKMRHFLERQCM